MYLLKLVSLMAFLAMANANVDHVNESDLPEDLSGGETVEDGVFEEEAHRALRTSKPRPSRGGNVPKGVKVIFDPKTGLNTYIMKLHILYVLRDRDFCGFDALGWCREYVEGMDIAIDVESDGYALAIAEAWSNCWITAKAFAKSKAIINAEASFKIKQRGRIGAVRQANFESQLDTCTLSVSRSSALAEAVAGATGEGIAYSDPDGICGSMFPPYATVEDYAICGDGFGEAEAVGYVYADASASSFSRAMAGTGGSNTVQIEAKGKNLESMDALVIVGASSFTETGGRSIARAYALAETDLRSESWTENCIEWCDWYCRMHRAHFCEKDWVELCEDAYARAEASADAIASAFGRAVANAAAKIEITAAVKANFSRNTFGDIDMGLEGAGKVKAGVAATCKA